MASEAMSDERLAVIRAMIALTDVGDAQLRAITELLAEVVRLRRDARYLANFPTVMDILDAALTGDVEKARSYAGVLADRYELQDYPRWASSVRRRLAPDYDPGPTYYLADEASERSGGDGA